MPDWRAEVRSRLRGLRLPAEREADIVDEMAGHLSDREAELRRDGLGAEEARRLVLDELADGGTMAAALARLRQARQPVPPPPPGLPAPARLVDQLAQDLRVGARSLLKRPGFTAAAVLALAIGIGGSTAIFSAVDAALLRPMPFPHADRLFVPVSVNLSRNIRRGSVSFADYTDWRQERSLFAAVALWRPVDVDLAADGASAIRAPAAQVSEEFFALVDVRPLMGRTLQPADHTADAPPVAVLAHGLWQRHFGGDASIVGRSVRLNGTATEIVGVLPARGVWPDAAELFVPLRPATLSADTRLRRDNMIFRSLARLHEGVAPESVNARLSAIAVRLAEDDPGSRGGWTNAAVPLRDYIVEGDLKRALWVLAGAVGFVLLIACANVANLSLVHGSGRARELALRLSLGASRRRLVQQLLVESAILTAAGAIAGAWLGIVIMKGLVAIAPAGTPFLDGLRFNARFAAGLVAIAGAATLLSGVVPAWSSSAVAPGTALREGSAGAGSSRRLLALRSVLVVGEVAAAVVLVTLAALLIRSFARLSRVDPGVAIDRVASGRTILPPPRYPDSAARGRLAEALVARLEQEPDIARAALTSFVPAGGGGFGLGRVFLEEGHPQPPAGPDVPALWNAVTPGYFETMGIAVMAGREFTARDDGAAPRVVVVSERFARAMFGDEPPLGRRIRSWRDENVLREVVGVVADVTVQTLADRGTPMIYVPVAQGSFPPMMVVARASRGPAAALGPVMQRAVSDVDPGLVVSDIEPLEDAARASVSSQRYTTLLLGLLSGAALALAGLGVYGVISSLVLLRRRELGIRLALGATRSSLYALVLRHGLRLAAAGLVLGIAGAAAAARVAASLLYATSPADPAAWAAMAAIVLASAVGACLLPARRAARADPTVALRAE